MTSGSDHRTITPYEHYIGGNPEAERLVFERLARELMRVQAQVQEAQWKAPPTSRGRSTPRPCSARRTRVLGPSSATCPPTFGPAVSPNRVPSTPSRAALQRQRLRQPDHKPDLRGAPSHQGFRQRARSAGDQFSGFACARRPPVRGFRQGYGRARTLSRHRRARRLAFTVGPSTTIRMLRNIAAGSRRKVSSLALETFWSRGAIRWGDAGPVRYLLRPAPGRRPRRTLRDRPRFPLHEFARRSRPGHRLRAVHPALRRRDRRRSRTRRSNGPSASPPVRWHALHLGRPSASPKRSPRAGDRRTGVQSMEHDRRIPPARQSEPCAQGRIRCKRVHTASPIASAARCRCATVCSAAAARRPSRSSTAASNGTSCRCG